MARELFRTKNRDESHARLAELLEDHPSAECREDPNAEEPYSVWDGAAEWVPTPPGPVVASAPLPAPTVDLDKLADLVVEKLKGGR